MKVTREQIIQIMPNAEKYVDKYLVYINGYSELFKIETPIRMAHFLSQVAHESNELMYTKELGNKNYFVKYDHGQLKQLLGNLKDGDGYKYRGRGLIQITGRANYQAYQDSKYCRGNIMDEPQLLEQPLGAVKSAMWWWWKHDLNKLADKDNFTAITKTINGGTNGLESRRKFLVRAKKVFNIA
jgi:putative chitinase